MATGLYSADFTKGNPLLPNPVPTPGAVFGPKTAVSKIATGPAPVSAAPKRKRKKLIILCDGTGQDSYGSNAQNPTNITRLARALAPNAWVKNADGDWEEWDQIISYHAGVGTFAGNNAFGLVFGEGLSEIVRAAYGFLVNNWIDGDKIYIFGFSRGAYIGRAIAGLVATHGLLTKRGMDNFHAVYQTFYMADESSSLKVPISETKQASREAAGLRPVRPGTVEVVGVFDTVGFHSPIKSLLQKFGIDLFGSDKNEYANTCLSDNVRYALHALSLDEERVPFQTTLFFRPKKLQAHEDENGKRWTTSLKQVWFSGAHSDIGGGMQNPRLSNIALAWMIDQLEGHNLLAFNKTYLVDSDEPAPKASAVPPPPSYGTYNSASVPEPWDTIKGANPESFSSSSSGFMLGLQRVKHVIMNYILWPFIEFLKFVVIVITIPGSKTSKWWTGQRKPGEYVPIENFKKRPDKKMDYVTCESLHHSIRDRLMAPKSPKRWWWPEKEWWPCKPLRGWQWGNEESQGNGWVKMGVEGELKVAKLGEVEVMLKGRMRFQEVLKPWFAVVPINVEEVAVPILDPLGERRRSSTS